MVDTDSACKDYLPVDSYSTEEDTPLAIDAAGGALANDTDADGQSLSAVVGTLPPHGTLAFNSDGSFVYTPVVNFNGSDSFTYKASDGTAQSAETTVTLTVHPVNDPPTTAGDSYAVAQDTALQVPGTQGVLLNDSDVDGDAITAVVVIDPASGTLSLNGDGSFAYTPSAGFQGTDSFAYQVSDGQLTSATAIVVIVVGPTTNVAPLAIDDNYTSSEGTLAIAAAQGVLTNDIDANVDPLTAQLVVQPDNGTLFLNDDGSFTYVPNSGYSGTDSFRYQVSDGQFHSNLAKVTIAVPATGGEGEFSILQAHDAALLSLLADHNFS